MKFRTNLSFRNWKYILFDLLPHEVHMPVLHFIIFVKRMLGMHVHHVGDWKPITWELLDIFYNLPNADCTYHNTVCFWVDGIGDWIIPIDKAAILYRKTNSNGRAYLRGFLLEDDRHKFMSYIGSV